MNSDVLSALTSFFSLIFSLFTSVVIPGTNVTVFGLFAGILVFGCIGKMFRTLLDMGGTGGIKVLFRNDYHKRSSDDE